MHTHDHVEYSPADPSQGAADSENPDIQGAWQTYREATTELAYYSRLSQFVTSQAGKKANELMDALRTDLKTVGADFDPAAIAQKEGADAKKLNEVLETFGAMDTYRAKWALAHEYLPSIRAKKKGGLFANATPTNADKRTTLETASGKALRALQGTRLIAGASKEQRVEAESQAGRLSVVKRDAGQQGHSDVQARNIAVARHGTTLLIGYNYTVKRFAGSETIVLESEPPEGLVADVLTALTAEMVAERSKADADPALKAIQEVKFVTVPGGEGWSGFHAEMQLLSYLQATVGAALDAGSVAFGVGKAVCRRCTAQLDAAQHEHRDMHFKRVTYWNPPGAKLAHQVKATATLPAPPEEAKKA